MKQNEGAWFLTSVTVFVIRKRVEMMIVPSESSDTDSNDGEKDNTRYRLR